MSDVNLNPVNWTAILTGILTAVGVLATLIVNARLTTKAHKQELQKEYVSRAAEAYQKLSTLIMESQKESNRTEEEKKQDLYNRIGGFAAAHAPWIDTEILKALRMFLKNSDAVGVGMILRLCNARIKYLYKARRIFPRRWDDRTLVTLKKSIKRKLKTLTKGVKRDRNTEKENA